jgi:CheY-like chemotaxis protein
MLPRVFVPFFQGDALAWRAEGGLGVGLSLVRGLVTLHGGSIEAFSEGANKGSEFVVQLPVGGTPPAETVRIKRDAQEPAPARALRVLLVDDNRDAADTCATLLELAGQHVEVAYSGRRALELAEKFHPQLVVLDISLPDLDGYEVARLMRGAEWGKGIVLVAATGWGREDDKQRAFAAGFNHHLTKPIAGEELLALLRSLSESRAD